MRFRRKKLSRSAIGIDIGPRRLRAVQIEQGESGDRLAASTMLRRNRSDPIPSAAELRQLVDALHRAGFRGREVILATPLEQQMGGVLDVPASSAVAQTQVARMELARLNRCAPEAMELGCWSLPDAGGEGTGARVMAVACPHECATAFLDRFEGAGFEVRALDVRACALARAAERISPQGNEMIAVVELNWSAALLALVQGGTVVYERKLADADLQRAHDQLCRRLQVEAEVADHLLLDGGLDAVAGDAPLPRQARAILSEYVDGVRAELAASLSYAMDEYLAPAPAALLLCGDGAAMPGLDRRLAGVVRTVQTLTPLDLVAPLDRHGEAFCSPGALAAIGLAMY